ncbi:MAG: sulfotransferase family 2 domain-containing protein [Hyphomonadaceae bacterium]
MFAEFEPRFAFHLNLLANKRPPRVVFLHIPKCGGTSINHHFKSNFGGKRTKRSILLDSVVGNAAHSETIEAAKHAQYVAGHFGWNTLERVRESAIAFTILREPFDRLRALYAFARKPRQIAHIAFAKLAEIARSASFEEFCLSEDPSVRAMTDNAITRTLAHDYFPAAPARAVDVGVARDHLDQLDFVGDVADLSAALPLLSEITQTRIVRGRTWLNQTPGAAGMTRQDFLADPALSARIAFDLEIYDYAKRRMA